MHDLDDPYPYYDSLREDRPVARVGDSSFYLVASRDLIAEVLRRPADFSSNLTATMVWNDDGTVSEFPIAQQGSPLHVLATADDPLHRRHRAMIMPSLAPTRVQELEPFIVRTLERLWDAGRVDDRIDWVAAVAQPLPMAAVAEIVGFPTCDLDDLRRWSFGSTVLLDGVVTAAELDDATLAVGELTAYLGSALADAVGASDAAGALGDIARLVDDGELDRDAALTILIQLIAAGAESTVSLLGNAVWLLGGHPDVEHRLRADRDLVSPFVEEALRLESPFRGHYRHVVADTDLGGTELPAGSHLYLLWGSANRDHDAVDNPVAIDLDRPKPRAHMAFGKGLHLCVGAALARLQAVTALGFLLDHTSALDVAVDDPQWEHSVLVRRLRSLDVRLTGSS
ncbi:cytochrome P450 [Gordonia sp. OPL2]|uniref:cytochrome P450 n=1 Tax=Gordonia sp. OPL2 TaxID=2486274 RepID=UPI0016565014|nr:cytochrome P450 [Gordonia sp. OPL2]RPA12380.1 cytochrome P450 [Gordonia sp. OPL2]